MTSLSPGLQSWLQRDSVTMFAAIEILLPAYSLRLLDGAGTLTFSGRTFVGQDDVFGTINTVEKFTDGLDADSPTLPLSLFQVSNAATVALADPAAQGSAVSVWVGAVNTVTGYVVSSPSLRFVGELDTSQLKLDINTRSLDMTITSAWERFFSDDEGVRLNSAFQQQFYASDHAFDALNSVTQEPYWGALAPAATTTAAPGGGSIAGGGAASAYVPVGNLNGIGL